MTEAEFRFKHSKLIEYYQFIEWRLRAICAAMLADEEKGWFERLDDYETDAFGALVKTVQSIQKEKHITLLTQEDAASLSALRQDRNYWVHVCFIGNNDQELPITFNKGELKRSAFEQDLTKSLNDAIEWDEKLVIISKQLKNILKNH